MLSQKLLETFDMRCFKEDNLSPHSINHQDLLHVFTGAQHTVAP